MKRIGVDVGGTFTDLILVDEEIGPDHGRQGPVDPRRPARGVVEGIRRLCEKAGVALARDRQPPARHHGRDEHRAHALGRRGRDDHDRGVPRHPAHRAAQEAVQLLAPAGAALAVAPARQAPPPADGRGARDGAERRRARARSTRTRCASACAQLRDAGVEAVAVCLLHSLPQPRPRAADQGDRARGVPGGLPLRLARGAAAVPRVRALLDRRPERLRRPQGLALRRALRRRPCRRRASATACS